MLENSIEDTEFTMRIHESILPKSEISFRSKRRYIDEEYVSQKIKQAHY